MKRIVLSMAAVALVLSGATNASAQKKGGFYSQPYKTRNSGSFSKSASLLSIGIGVPNAYGYYNVSLPPVYVKYEHGITDEIGIGILGGLGMGSYKFAGDKYTYLETTIGALGYYHFNKLIPVSKLDVYAGVGIGLNIRDDNYANSNSTNAVILGKAGARYYFNPKFAVYAEAGYDNLSPVNAGITLKF